jgi:hypothetical protein
MLVLQLLDVGCFPGNWNSASGATIPFAEYRRHGVGASEDGCSLQSRRETWRKRVGETKPTRDEETSKPHSGSLWFERRLSISSPLRAKKHHKGLIIEELNEYVYDSMVWYPD